MNLKEIKKYDSEYALEWVAKMADAKRRMGERQRRQNKEFIWSPENVEKLFV